MIEPGQATLSIQRQCELLSLSRASYCYTPAAASALNLELMRLIRFALAITKWRPGCLRPENPAG